MRVTRTSTMRLIVATGAATVVTTGALAVSSATAHAAPCSGSSCVGKDPEQTGCNDDAKTIGAMDVQGRGMLELRYSPTCFANWGRFSSYWRGDVFGAISGGTSYARVTAWNPGGPSQGVSGSRIAVIGGATWWSGMVDANAQACTGVELYTSDPTPGGMSHTANESLGWNWGPCG